MNPQMKEEEFEKKLSLLDVESADEAKSSDDTKSTSNDIESTTNHNDEEKEISTDVGLSYCRGLNAKPLAVPMIADTQQQSVTRNDAKIITESRLKRLKELSQQPEAQLSKNQQNEKKRIIRLEKNRRAAAMSRRKKKMYVKNLEDKYGLMSRHLAVLEMENAHLRALLSATQPPPMQMSAFKMFPNIPRFRINPIPPLLNSNVSSNNSTNNNSIEPQNIDNIHTNMEPSSKRRKLNDGSSMSPSIEPLPINNNVIPQPTGIPMCYMGMPLPGHGMPPNITNMHSFRYMPYPPTIPMNHMASHYEYDKTMGTICIENDDEEKVDTSVEIQERNNVENTNNNQSDEVPPEIIVPDLNDDYLSVLDDDIMDDSADDYALQQTDAVYL